MNTKILSTLALLFCAGQAFSQAIEIPLDARPALELLNQRKVNCPVLPAQNLPFFEDFSNQGPFPSCGKWVDRDVFVGDGYAVRAPSLGAATFDGLNENGRPYSPGLANTQTAPSDSLTSQPINLAGLPNVYLYYEYQRGGNGDRPEVADSFWVEGRTAAGTWTILNRHAGGGNDTAFVVGLSTLPASCLHGAFQLRFRNSATCNGNNDHWHLDYVYINTVPVTLHQPPLLPGGIFPDAAFARKPKLFLKNYTSMPLSHFKTNVLAQIDTVPTFTVINHNTGNSSDMERKNWNITDVGTGQRVYFADGGTRNGVLRPQVPYDDVFTIDPFGFSPLRSSFIQNYSGSTMSLRAQYSFRTNNNNTLEPRNDTAYQTATFADYYAYDDGEAESRVIVQALQNELAVEYTSLNADRVWGFMAHIPYSLGSITATDVINVHFYKDTLQTRVWSENGIIPFRLQAQATNMLNGWWTFQFNACDSNLLKVNAGQKFFIGMERVSGTNAVPVGLDRSNGGFRSKSWSKTNSTWSRFGNTLNGALMIRPLMRPFVPCVGLDEVFDEIAKVTISPNPSNGTFSVQGLEAGDQLQVSDILGRVVWSAYTNGEIQEIQLDSPQNGLYIFTQVRDGKIIGSGKVLVND